MIIEDLSSAGKRFSSQHQILSTKLPSPDDGTSNLKVFGRCYDALGRHKTAQVTINIEGGDTV